METIGTDRRAEGLPKDESTVQIIAEVIRKNSQAGRLTPESEIFRELVDRGLLPAGPDEISELFASEIAQALKENQDLAVFSSQEKGRFFSSSQFMSNSYARLLVYKEGDPLFLISSVVRENSAVYPRPVSLTLFQSPPFDLSPEEIHCCLDRMVKQREYEDIQQTKTSIGTVFLYSTSHLEAGHAAMLAEWLDVAQFNSP